MRNRAPFMPDDLAELDAGLLEHALAIVPMSAVADGNGHPQIIGLRHDIDNVIEPAVEFARWEAERGYRSTYFVLHTAPYWRNKTLLRKSLEMIAECGHEIGIHNNALAAALLTGIDPRAILAEAIAELRSYGFDIRGTVAHGDPLCRHDGGKVRFVNDELFAECARPAIGEPMRTIGAKLTIQPTKLEAFDLEYDANWLARAAYLSDSGGQWSVPFADIAAGFPYDGQLHMLVHPDWWPQAFSEVLV